MNEPNLVKKRSFTDSIIKKQKMILVIAVICLITLFAGSSYSLLTNFDTGTDNHVLYFENDNMQMTVNKAGLINISKSEAISDEDGLSVSVPVVLTFTNTGSNLIAKYAIILNNDKTTTLDTENIKYAISTDYGVNYSKPSLLTATNNIIYTSYNLEVNKSKTIYLKIWIKKEATETYDKIYNGNLEVKLESNADIPYANKLIIKTLGTPTGVIGIEDENSSNETFREYRYSGQNVHNYVSFNNETWRILGVFKENSEEYLKIVRDEILESKKIPDSYVINKQAYNMKKAGYNDSYVYFNKMETSNWADTSLQSYLNTNFDEGKNKGYLGYFSNETKKMLSKENYYIGNVDSNKVKSLTSYLDEHLENWQGEVALMTISDYLYSFDQKYFALKVMDETAKESSWIYETMRDTKNAESWLLTPSKDSNKVFILDTLGDIVEKDITNIVSGIRPVVNLNSKVLIVNGDGTRENPYELSF